MTHSDRYRILVNGEELVFSWETEEEARAAGKVAHAVLPHAEVRIRCPDLILWARCPGGPGEADA